MNDFLKLDVSNILSKDIGSRDFYGFSEPANFKGLNLKKDLSGELEIINGKEGLEIGLNNIKCTAEVECEKCLEKFNIPVEVKHAECTFLFKEPEKIKDPFDVYLVNMKKRRIDLNEVLRQEIILHFPMVPVCFKGCKGLCPVCGKNRNKSACKCKNEINTKEYKPFANLQQLINKTHG